MRARDIPADFLNRPLLRAGQFIRQRLDSGLQPIIRHRVRFAAQLQPLALLLDDSKLLEEKLIKCQAPLGGGKVLPVVRKVHLRQRLL